MKKLLTLCTIAFFFLPFSVKAEEKVKVPVYLFRGEGCPHCEDALTYFNGLDEEDKKKIDVVKYEVWYNEENEKLMAKVAEKLGETVTGVPYIVVGEKSFSGFTDSIGEAIMDLVNEMYENDNIVDLVADIETDALEDTDDGITEDDTNKENNTNTNTSKNEKKGNDVIVIIGVCGTILVSCALLVLARKNM